MIYRNPWVQTRLNLSPNVATPMNIDTTSIGKMCLSVVAENPNPQQHFRGNVLFVGKGYHTPPRSKEPRNKNDYWTQLPSPIPN